VAAADTAGLVLYIGPATAAALIGAWIWWRRTRR